MYEISSAAAELINKAVAMDYSGLELVSHGVNNKYYRYSDLTGVIDVETNPVRRKISYTHRGNLFCFIGINNAHRAGNRVKLSFEGGHIVLEVIP